MQGEIFAAYKPIFESSNHFLGRIKRIFGVKKAGFSGTLDPFAKGVLLVATEGYTRLLPHICVEPKCYRATLWLGAKSQSLDIENIESVTCIPPFSWCDIQESTQQIQGVMTYTPPIFSAKKIQGKRAYMLAREGKEVVLDSIQMQIFSFRIIHYIHPFLTFEVALSKGGYVRSIGQMIANRLNVSGVLSSLERCYEGEIFIKNHPEKQILQKISIVKLNPLKLIKYPILSVPNLKESFLEGKKLKKSDLNVDSTGCFIVEFEDFFSIIRVEKSEVKYLLNRIEKC
ncbi:tRNA pseudouridine(55) synthase TruB [Helicobacter monodelphidis]|uniref:tRNA pseudouridine(55) synthase TruB n=1 Tax=Helicobacter sp. 15-1451 TaxID=2004995 RepID=UPI000DCCA52F|nr:tRNA pseudouridine(55) synthase TruB [Helicobacter sp. 15-1451]RAX58119.1 tRNA pseudouridine(55) synthase TruB [Helicobacter sp. 15-1451]